MQKRCSQSSGGGHPAIKTAINPMDSPPSSAGLFPSLLLVLLLCCLPLSRRGGAHMLLDQMCVDAGNYTPDSTYESNLRRLLPSLSSAASASGVGFFSASTGESPDRISGLGLCRGDIDAADCRTCLDGASVDALQLCPYAKTAVIWYDHCLLRYSDRKLTSAFNNSEQVFTYNAVNITGGRFPGYGQNTAIYDFVNEAVNALLSDLADSAASNSNSGKLFASGELTITSGFPTIHALVQCAPDMSGPECRRCIQGQISETLSVFDGRQAGRVLGVWCNLRYEAYTFYDGHPTRRLSSDVPVDGAAVGTRPASVRYRALAPDNLPASRVLAPQPPASSAPPTVPAPPPSASSATPAVPAPSGIPPPASSAPPTVPAPPPSASSATPAVPAPPGIPPPASAAPLTAPAPPRIPPPGSSAPLRLPAPPQIPTASPRPGPPPGKKKLRVIIIITTCVTVLLISCCLLCLLYIKRRRRAERATFSFDTDEVIKLWKSEESRSEFTLFDFATIANSTNNFSIKNKLGEGGFGPVYKGLLSDGLEIAIKRLSARSGQGLVEFKNEIKLIARLQHRNLVRLLGCCIQGEEKILIYEYMPNKSLDFFIFDQTRGATLDWQKRFIIIEGIAQGLLYLHKHSRLRIIHRDLKASNILLDSEMYPKISDFGLARIFGRNETHANTNRVVGTYGYISPEYASEGIFSVKSDVFSFGVLLLEIVSGKRNAGFHQYGNHLNLLGYAWEIWKDGRWFELIDPSLDGGSETNEILRCIHVALMCVQENAADRPTMSDVIAMLSSDRMNLPDPKHPAYFNVRINNEEEMASNFIVPVSNNEITFTGLEGR